MNAALYLLNALAMIAVLSFHFLTSSTSSQAHIDVKDWVQRPVAQRAGMQDHGKAPTLMTHSPVDRDLFQGAGSRLDRYTF